MKLFLLNADTRDRVTKIKEDQLVDVNLKTAYYKPVTTHIHYKLDSTAFYNVIASTFKTDKRASGTITLECD